MMFDDLIGKPYTKEHDCNWLAREIAHRMGLNFPEVKTPDDKNDWNKCIQNTIIKYYEKTKDIKPGYALIFRFFDRFHREEWHIGTVLPEGKSFITTREGLGVHVIELTNRVFITHLMGIYKLKDEQEKDTIDM